MRTGASPNAVRRAPVATVRRVATPVSPDRSRPGQLSKWLLAVASLVFAIVVVGGATRLTQSGLSITSWKPVSGVIPPLSSTAWDKEFDAYRATPEFRLVNEDMTLSRFKGIFWWEYVHRLLGRIIGLVLVVPFAWFLVRRTVPRGFGWRLAGLAALVGLQGAIGWWMVASGLVDRPDVAHERLALHLVTALTLFAALIWTALDLRALAEPRSEGISEPETGPSRRRPRRWVVTVLCLLTVQIVLGAFVAGLDAGRFATTWPKVDGRWVPDGLGDLSPWWSNLVDNPVTVQFLHRGVAWLVAACAFVLAIRLLRAGAAALATLLEVVVSLQFLLGVLTLLNAVPVALGVAHQAVGTLLVAVTVVAAHWCFRERTLLPPVAR